MTDRDDIAALVAELIASALHTYERGKIIKRINDGKISASMSGIEYYPPWTEAHSDLRQPFYAAAEAMLVQLPAADALTRIQAETVERCAKVAEERVAGLSRDDGEPYWQGQIEAADDIAAAIRALKGEG